MIKAIIKNIILPGSVTQDQVRREFILNILLIGLLLLSGIAFFINLLAPILYNDTAGTSTPALTGGIAIFFLLLLILSRKGRSRIAASLFITALLLVGVYENFYWGSDLAVVVLLFALTIVMAGVLTGTKAAFFVTICSATSILLFTYLEIIGATHPNLIRKTEVIHMSDSIIHAVIFLIIAIVSWLFNRDSMHALERARKSELALKKEKDLLEIEVERRTQELRQAQAEKLAQLYRISEFGRVASGLFHDLANPLGLVALNLDRLNEKGRQLKRQEIKKLLDRAIIGTKRLESFIFAARQQIQNQEVLHLFSLTEEIEQIIKELSYKAKKAHVQIVLHGTKKIQTFGNPIKFSQVITNLICNAIDAYDSARYERIEITVREEGGKIRLTVEDWGRGIQSKDFQKIFDPLFTTKNHDKSIGMGLAICRDIIEKDFNGSIMAINKKKRGAKFVIVIPVRKAPTGIIKVET